MVVVQYCECTKYLCIVSFKTVNFLLFEFHLNKLFKKKQKTKQATRRMWPMDSNVPIPVITERLGWFSDSEFLLSRMFVVVVIIYPIKEQK